MDIEIVQGPGNSAAHVKLAMGEVCTAESGAMLAMSANMQVTTTTHTKSKAGFGRGVRRLVAGESFFLSHFEPRDGPGELWLATPLSGDMVVREMTGHPLIVQAGSYIACADSVSIDLGWTGFRAVLSGERFFWLKIGGTGKVLLASFGAIYPIEVDGEHIVDTGHIVAFEESLEYTLTKAGRSWVHSFLGGEGLVCRFRGRGTVWCQSHDPHGFGARLAPMLKPRR